MKGYVMRKLNVKQKKWIRDWYKTYGSCLLEDLENEEFRWIYDHIYSLNEYDIEKMDEDIQTYLFELNTLKLDRERRKK
jgi:hypothetical protein